MLGMLSDLRVFARLAARQKFDVAVAILGLAAAVAVSLAVRHVGRAIALPTSGIERPEALRVLRTVVPQGSQVPILSYRHFVDLWSTPAMPDACAYFLGSGDISARNDDFSPNARVAYVSQDCFDVFGAKATLGRLIDGTDKLFGEALPQVVLSHDAWSRWLAASPAALGSVVSINSRPHSVVGVLRAGFIGPTPARPPAVWVAMSSIAGGARRPEDDPSIIPTVILRPEHPAQVAVLQKTLAREFLDGAVGPGARISLEPLDSNLASREARLVARGIDSLALIVVLVGTINLAGVFSTLLSGRSREWATRCALGASKSRICRQLAVEGLVVATIGAFTATLLFPPAANLLASRLDLPIGFAFAPTGGAISAGGLAIVMTLVVVLLQFGALGAKGGPLALGTGTVFRRPSPPAWARHLLVGGQLVVAVCACGAAVMFARAGQAASNGDPGIALDELVALSGQSLDPEWTVGAADAYWKTATILTEEISRVRAVTFARHVFGGGNSVASIDGPTGKLFARLNRVAPNYFSTVGNELAEGRFFMQGDTTTDAASAIVSSRLADQIAGRDSVVGMSIKLREAPGPVTIVGVVNDSLGTDLFDATDTKGVLYLPLETTDSPRAFLIARTDGSTSAVAREIERRLPAVLGSRPVRVTQLGRVLQNQVRVAQMPGQILQLLAYFAVALAILGVHSQVSVVVALSSRSITVRRALGASKFDLLQFCASLVGPAVMVAIVCGIAAILLIQQAMSRLLFGVTFDGLSAVVVVLSLLVIVSAGLWRSYLKVSRLQPQDLLRLQE